MLVKALICLKYSNNGSCQANHLRYCFIQKKSKLNHGAKLPAQSNVELLNNKVFHFTKILQGQCIASQVPLLCLLIDLSSFLQGFWTPCYQQCQVDVDHLLKVIWDLWLPALPIDSFLLWNLMQTRHWANCPTELKLKCFSRLRMYDSTELRS